MYHSLDSEVLRRHIVQMLGYVAAERSAQRNVIAKTLASRSPKRSP